MANFAQRNSGEALAGDCAETRKEHKAQKGRRSPEGGCASARCPSGFQAGKGLGSTWSEPLPPATLQNQETLQH
ncbi:Hypothetical predicted protein [Podarcis lilfordi]|uniref:Uncharacterized protein n=1 Tax=Podarcis lilfordi TaxID=74358 RepID=A0AA35LCQ9_9SAUR|nr:Hypothetical predicted protein [Podarcis lilfordi]